MSRWRFLVVTVAFIVVVSTCGGSGETSDDGPINVGNPGSSEGLFAAFEAIGIDIIDGPEAGSGDRLELWSYQVENLEREVDAGGGYFGRQLDAIAGAPGGMAVLVPDSRMAVISSDTGSGGSGRSDGRAGLVACTGAGLPDGRAGAVRLRRHRRGSGWRKLGPW